MKKYQSFSSENFQFLEVKFSIYLNRCVFVMQTNWPVQFAVLSSYRYLNSYLTCKKKTNKKTVVFSPVKRH